MLILNGIDDTTEGTTDDANTDGLKLFVVPEKIIAVALTDEDITFLITQGANPEGSIGFKVKETQQQIAVLRAIWDNSGFVNDALPFAVEWIDGEPKTHTIS